jgi:hypothetical protein
VKWLLRIAGIIVVLLTLGAAAAWYAFPRYAQSVIDRALEGKNIRLVLHEPGLPNLRGMSFGRIDLLFSTPADSCTGIVSTYSVTVTDGKLSWKRAGSSDPRSRGMIPLLLPLALELHADSLKVRQEPADLSFSDGRPVIRARLDILRKRGPAFEFVPQDIGYAIEDGALETGKLRIEGIAYRFRLARSFRWIQEPAPLSVSTLLSNGEALPLSNFQATFGLQRNPEKPCVVTFSDCSLDLFDWKAATPRIEYSLRKKETRFTLELKHLALDELPGFTGGGDKRPFGSGTVSGRIPVEYRDSTVTLRNAVITAGSGSRLMYYTTDGKPFLSIDASHGKNSSEIFRNLNATITLSSRNNRISGIAFSGLSTTFLGGTLTSTPARYDPLQKTSSFTLRMDRIPLLERIRLQGDFKGALKGTISGKVPVSLINGRLAIRNARLSSEGGGTIEHSPKQKKEAFSARIFGPPKPDATYLFSEPDVTLNRESDGRTTIGFTLKNLIRRNSGGEMLLLSPKGELGLWQDRNNPALVSLSRFSAGFFTGTVAIDHVDFDMEKKTAETVLILNNIPLQKLLDLQGARKIYATGLVRGKIPVIMHDQVFEIPQGGMDAEQSGQIIYSTTPEERAAANQGLRITYEALANFLYSELVSSITMAQDGNSVITLQLKGHNPDFQNGRPVNLNLRIEQNLLDLFRSLSISSSVEQLISEKALQLQKK